MAITHSLGAYNKPFHYNANHRTPRQVDMLQTSTSGATAGSMNLVGSASASDEFHIVSLQVSITNPTATAYVDFIAGDDIIATFPTVTAAVTQFQSLYFGETGLVVGTTTTFTAEVFVRTATATVRSVLTGYRVI